MDHKLNSTFYIRQLETIEFRSLLTELKKSIELYFCALWIFFSIFSFIYKLQVIGKCQFWDNFTLSDSLFFFVLFHLYYIAVFKSLIRKSAEHRPRRTCYYACTKIIAIECTTIYLNILEKKNICFSQLLFINLRFIVY